MLRAWSLASFLSIAACISYPEVTLVDETRDAPVSPDGSATAIALVDDLAREARATPDGGVLPHPKADAGADAQPASTDPDTGDPSDDDGSDDDDDDGKGKGKGKPPKPKD